MARTRVGAMKFGDRRLAACEGAILAHSVDLDGTRLAKGRLLSAADLDAARQAGRERLTVAEPSPADLREDDAASLITSALSGSGLDARPPANGRVDLVARTRGLLCLDPRVIDRVNRIGEAIGLATLPAFATVEAGEICATLKIVPFAVRAAAAQRAAKAASVQPLTVEPFRALSADLIHTQGENPTPKLEAKTAAVTRTRLEALGGRLTSERAVPHKVDSLGDALAEAGSDLVLVAGVSATTDRRDVVPAAIRKSGGTVLRLGMPVDPGNLLLLARRGAQWIVGLPGCARSPKRNGFDMVLERLFAGLPVSSRDIAALGAGGLLKGSERPSR
ncbi:hypothetical protein B5C34_01855 [Pacificimonas flava]|uniref:MoaB/Mog domain-containing protein n=2 Tax=Pacificimonas TaxID=1960290 RepID=A0A219B1V9_9SPHN|nr:MULTISPECIES: molybdopterin-binding protein [Pacificimonas]MBZ6378037.1 molybdopterin-binding protein [Pacificimonas aurantium]OWV32320.1 hypothetical protein B5C34_01855 [Pacificimonas flava]